MAKQENEQEQAAVETAPIEKSQDDVLPLHDKVTYTKVSFDSGMTFSDRLGDGVKTMGIRIGENQYMWNIADVPQQVIIDFLLYGLQAIPHRIAKADKTTKVDYSQSELKTQTDKLVNQVMNGTLAFNKGGNSDAELIKFISLKKTISVKKAQEYFDGLSNEQKDEARATLEAIKNS